jgi:hypothetical protein
MQQRHKSVHPGMPVISPNEGIVGNLRYVKDPGKSVGLRSQLPCLGRTQQHEAPYTHGADE